MSAPSNKVKRLWRDSGWEVLSDGKLQERPWWSREPSRIYDLRTVESATIRLNTTHRTREDHMGVERSRTLYSLSLELRLPGEESLVLKSRDNPADLGRDNLADQLQATLVRFIPPERVIRRPS